MTTTDKQLKQALAKMLPDQILHYDTYYSPKHDAHLKDGLFWIGGDEILDTEWLHVCRLVEQALPQDNSLLGKVCYDNNLMVICGSHQACVSASWQQRAIALCKAKEIEL